MQLRARDVLFVADGLFGTLSTYIAGQLRWDCPADMIECLGIVDTRETHRTQYTHIVCVMSHSAKS